MSKNAKESEEKSKGYVHSYTKCYRERYPPRAEILLAPALCDPNSTRWSGQYEASDPGQKHRNH